LAKAELNNALSGEVFVALSEMTQSADVDELMKKFLEEFEPTQIRPDQTVALIYKI
jgi:hypothetical protein